MVVTLAGVEDGASVVATTAVAFVLWDADAAVVGLAGAAAVVASEVEPTAVVGPSVVTLAVVVNTAELVDVVLAVTVGVLAVSPAVLVVVPGTVVLPAAERHETV